MGRLMSVGVLLAALLAALGAALGAPARAQTVPALPAPDAEAPPGTFLLTVFLRHDQSKTVDEINAHLKATGWYEKFPGAGVEIVSWYVMMGVGQVVTLRVPAERLRDVNRIIEGTAWGGYRTEFYPTYDYRGLWEDAKRRARQ
jgi:hypothetical protein